MKFLYKKNKVYNLLLSVFLSLSFIILYSSNAYSFLTLEDAQYKGGDTINFDYENTYADLSKRPGYLLDGKLIIVGDSYSFLLAANCGYPVNYIVHQGYVIDRINKELVPEIPDNNYKYAFLFIGPNDFMDQTDIVSFSNSLIEISEKIKNKGARLIVTNYLTPNINTFTVMPPGYINCSIYDFIIKDLTNKYNIIYYDILSYSHMFGFDMRDGIHPSKSMYKPIIEGLINYINDIEKGRYYS